MLLRLNISNFAIVENLEIEFSNGLNIITGQTGAGKSIIIDSLGLIMGKKASESLVRTGVKQAQVEAVFDVTNSPQINIKLADKDIESSSELIIRRVISATGRQKAYINDISVSVSYLEFIASELISVHGQHGNQKLLNSATHLELLDTFGKLDPLKAKVKQYFEAYKAELGLFNKLTARLNERQSKIDQLTEQIDELEKAKLIKGEDEGLELEALTLNNAEKLSVLYSSALYEMYDSGNSVVSKIQKIVDTITEAVEFDSKVSPLYEQIKNALYIMEDSSHELKKRFSQMDFSPPRLEFVNSRLSQLQQLQKKYGVPLNELIEHKEHLEKRLVDLHNLDIAKDELQNSLNAIKAHLLENSQNLSTKRKEQALLMDQLVIDNLKKLSMDGAVFKTDITQKTNKSLKDGSFVFSATGIDNVNFLVSMNPGQQLSDLSKTASGGELSRLMLSIISTQQISDPSPTIIFDEIDTGISGSTAEIVGMRLKNISQSHQVLCVTHLAQIAAFANTHFKVEKQVVGGNTFTGVSELKNQSKIDEVARIIGGTEITDKTLKLAQEMLSKSA